KAARSAPEAWPCGRAHLGHSSGRWTGTRRKETDDRTAARTRTSVRSGLTRGAGRSRAGGWAGTPPRGVRGGRGGVGGGRPGAQGDGRDRGLRLARRSPARGSEADEFRTGKAGHEGRLRHLRSERGLNGPRAPRCGGELWKAEVIADARTGVVDDLD